MPLAMAGVKTQYNYMYVFDPGADAFLNNPACCPSYPVNNSHDETVSPSVRDW